MASSLGGLVLHLAANTAGFIGDLGKAAHEAAKSMGTIKSHAGLAGDAMGLLGVATGTVAASVATFGQIALNIADNMTKMAQGAGLSTENMSELAWQARLAGVNAEQLSIGIAKLNKGLVDSAGGAGEANRALAAMGISVEGADGKLKNVNKIIEEVADKFKDYRDGAGKSAIASMLFGQTLGAQMVPMLNAGSEGMRKAAEEARALGIVITDRTGPAAELFNDNITRLRAVSEGFGLTVAEKVVGPLNNMLDALIANAKETKALETASLYAANVLKVFIAGIIGAGAGIRITIGYFQNLIDAWKEFGKIEFSATDLLFPGRAFQKFVEAGERARATLKAGMSADVHSIVNATREMVEALWAPVTAAGDAAAEAAARAAKGAAPVVMSAKEIAEAKRKEAEALREAKREYDELIDRLSRMSLAQARAVEAAEDAAIKQSELNRIAAEQIGLQFLTEEAQAEESFSRQAEKLRQALDDKVITYQYYNEVLALLEEQHQKRLTDIQNKGLTDREKFERMSLFMKIKTVSGVLETITAGVAQHNRALFEINKVAAIATAIISAHEGASKTLGTYPWPLAGILAGIHYAAGAARVAAIAGTSFGGGGGSAPSLAGSTPAMPVTPVPVPQPAEQPMPQTTIILQGESYTQKQVRELVEALFENSRDGGPRFA